MAVRELFAKFGFEFDKDQLAAMSRAVDKAETQVEQLAKAADKAGAEIRQKLAPAAQAAQAGLDKVSRAATDSRRRVHGSAGALADWGAQAKRAGVSSADLRKAVAGLALKVQQAAGGNKELASSFRALGVDVQKVAHSGRSSSSVWAEMVGRLSKVRHEADRTRMAVHLLGKEGARVVLPALGGGAGGLRAGRRTGDFGGGRVPTIRAPSAGGMTSSLLQASFWEGLARSIFQADAAIVKFGFSMAAGLVSKVAETTVWMDRLQKSLGLISGFGQFTGIKEFEEITQTAGRLGLNIVQAADSYKQLRAVGFARNDANELVRLSADMQKGLGLTEETIGRVQLALAQIKGAGVLQGDELRQLQETGISTDLIWKSIAEQMGITVEKAKKLKEEGKVSADVAIKAVKDAVLGTLGTSEAGQAAKELGATTFQGILDGAKASMQLWFVGLAGEFAPKLDELAKLFSKTFSRLTESGDVDRILTHLKRLVIDTIDLIVIRWPEIENIIFKVAGSADDSLSKLIMRLDDLLTVTIKVVDFIVTHWDGIQATVVAGSAAMALAVAAIGAASVINAVKTVIGVIGGIGTKAVATEATVAVASKGMAVSFGTVAKAAGAIGLALGAWVVALDQFKKLMNEVAPEGGLFKTLNKISETGQLGARAKIRGKVVDTPVEEADKRAPKMTIGGFGSFGAPMAPPSRSSTVTIVDQSTTKVDVTAPSPGEAARQVGKKVGEANKGRVDGIHRAVAGAQRG